MLQKGLPSGPMVKNPCADPGDTGWLPGQGTENSHVARHVEKACEPQ